GVLERERRDREHADPVFVDEERILVRPMDRATALDDAQASRGNLVDDAMVEQDDAVRDVLFEVVARQGALAALARDDRGDPLLLEPAEQAPQLRAHHRHVEEVAEEHLDRVEDDALGADRVDGMPQADEESVQVVLARLLDLAPLDADVIDDELLLAHQLVQAEAEGADVLA